MKRYLSSIACIKLCNLCSRFPSQPVRPRACKILIGRDDVELSTCDFCTILSKGSFRISAWYSVLRDGSFGKPIAAVALAWESQIDEKCGLIGSGEAGCEITAVVVFPLHPFDLLRQ